MLIPDAVCIAALIALGVCAGLLAWFWARLREKNDYSARIFDQGSQAAALVSAEGRVTRINQEFTRMAGLRAQDAVGRSLRELIVPRDAYGEFDGLAHLLNRAQRGRVECLCMRQDGSRFPASFTCVPVSPASPRIAAYVLCHDLTEQKRAEQSRAGDEGRWRAIFDTSAVGISVTDKNGQLVATNRAYQQLLGYTAEELSAMTYMDLTYEPDRVATAILNAEIEDGTRKWFQIEKRYRRKDGRLIWVRVTVSQSPETPGVPKFGMGIVEDITEQKLAEERLREYEKVVENAREMIVVQDRDYRHLIANQAFLKYRGLTREQVIGHLPREFADIDLFENIIRPRLDEAFQGRPVEFELTCPNTMHGVRELRVSYLPIEGPNGVDRVAGVLEDITDEKRSKEELQRSFDQLRALTAQMQTVREQERTRLARELHDELGQALTGIKMDLASLQAGASREHVPGSFAAKIGSIMNYVDRTIHSVRRISTELRPGILDDLGLVAALEWATEEFQGRTGIKCQASLPEDDLAVDPERATAVFRIFQETLTNIARHAGASHVDIRLAQENGDLALAVHDDGRGIGDSPQQGSLGILGMRERARLMGGDFVIAGHPEGGTTVSVRIPRHS